MIIENLIGEIKKQYKDGNFVNYIEYIQFPKYKNLAPNSKIDFEFPLTMLVGKNGTGKSSVLQAMYGTPAGKSTGDYWFSTQVDPISEGENKYFYGYKKDKKTKVKEVIKKRQPSIKAFDYWETAALNTKVGMLPDDDMDNESRNSPVEKEVVYFDFRGELSAFDKYFHFYKSKSDKIKRKFEQKNKESKEYIKNQSKYLYKIFDGEKRVTYPNHPENVLHDDMEIINITNNKKCLDAINDILGKNYIEIKRVYHRVYQSWGTSVFVKTSDGKCYSEANAGSGESAIINMVCAIMNAKHNSLILLDEPEVSLHPSAQKNLKKFLLQMIKKYHHQIIIFTHSVILIEKMPKESLKLFETNDNGTIDIINGVYYSEAFLNIKEEVEGKNSIICEDSSAKILIEEVLNNMGIGEYFSVEYRHGGADTLMTKYLPIFALDKTIYDKVFLILDGDKEPDEVIRYSDIPIGHIDNLDKLEGYIRGLTSSQAIIQPLVDGNKKNGKNVEQTKAVYKEYLQYAENHLYFLPHKLIPEAIVLSEESVRENTNKCYDEVNNSNAKEIMGKICNTLFSDKTHMDSCMNMLTKQWGVKRENSEYKEMEKLLGKIYEYCNQ